LRPADETGFERRPWTRVDASLTAEHTRLVNEFTAVLNTDYPGVLQLFDVRSRPPACVGVYHRSHLPHFGSKAGLYDLVRTEVERRIRDRMEGAYEAGNDLATVLVVGLDAARRLGVVRLLAEEPPAARQDVMRTVITGWGDAFHPGAGKLVTGLRLAALDALAEGDDPGQVRDALVRLLR
jgi:hypothetical protein